MMENDHAIFTYFGWTGGVPALQITTIFDNPDTARGIAQLGGQSAGFIGIQSYPSSPMTFRDIWIK
jgi:hypothetical protein